MAQVEVLALYPDDPSGGEGRAKSAQTGVDTYIMSENLDVVGVVSAETFEPDSDTSAGDNAAIGYTAAEGLILTGQGSTNDITIKNDADGTVITIPTGTTTTELAGTLDMLNQLIDTVKRVAIDGQTASYTGSTIDPAFISIEDDHTWAYSGTGNFFGDIIIPPALKFSGTQTISGVPNITGMGFLFHNTATITSDANRNFGAMYTLVDQHRFDGGNFAITHSAQRDILLNPTAEATGTGSYICTNWENIYVSTTVNAGGTITNRKGIIVNNVTGAGTITSQAGVCVNALSKGTNNTAILTGTATIPSGDWNIYQSGTESNQLDGTVFMLDNLPTSDPSNTGQLWLDGTTVKVSA